MRLRFCVEETTRCFAVQASVLPALLSKPSIMEEGSLAVAGAAEGSDPCSVASLLLFHASNCHIRRQSDASHSLITHRLLWPWSVRRECVCVQQRFWDVSPKHCTGALKVLWHVSKTSFLSWVFTLTHISPQTLLHNFLYCLNPRRCQSTRVSPVCRLVLKGCRKQILFLRCEPATRR